MPKEPRPSHDELEGIARQYRHLKSEHRRARAEGSGRRHLAARLAEVERRFERLLAEWVEEEGERERWRRHFHGGGPGLAQPGVPGSALVFKGRSESGSALAIRERAGGDHDIEADGKLTRRISGRLRARGRAPEFTFREGDVEFREIFESPRPALEALRAFVAEPVGEPPWQHASQLFGDGLIDRHFALTDRGRRALARHTALG